MDNKTKVKVAVVIGIIVLAVIFIFMVVFVKGNRNSKKNDIPTRTPGSYSQKNNNTTEEPVNNSEEDDQDGQDVENKTDKDQSDDDGNVSETLTLDNVTSLGIKDNNLVKINNDMTSSVVTSLKNGYTDFCYGDEKAYISYKNEDGSSSIVEIDLLKSDYPEKTILSMENTEINNLEYYSGKIYFVTENGRLVEYSIDEENTNFWTEENETSSFVIDKNNNCLYFSYKPNGENPGIYSLDFTSNTYTELVTLNDFAGELLLNGDSLVIDAKEYQSIYVYNNSLVSVTGIGSDNLNSTSKQVDFFGDLILYTNGEKVDIKDSSGNSYQDNWYNSNGDLFTDVSMISSNNLQVTREDGQNSVIIDLTTGNITEMEGSPYSDVVIIK